MHQCLQVPELLNYILRFVPPYPSAVVARKHLLSCALTCKLFAEVALDIIWHTQPNLIVLLRMLHREKRNIDLNALYDGEFVRVSSHFPIR